jgi:hypothetical protein
MRWLDDSRLTRPTIRRLPMTDTIYKNVRYREDIKDLFTSYELDWPELKAASVNNDYVALANDKGQVIFLRLPHLLLRIQIKLI